MCSSAPKEILDPHNCKSGHQYHIKVGAYRSGEGAGIRGCVYGIDEERDKENYCRRGAHNKGPSDGINTVFGVVVGKRSELYVLRKE